MYPLTVQQLRNITDATILGDVNPDNVVQGCVIDSRSVRAGDAFFAMAGSKHHGVQFAQDAIQHGADVVFVEKAMSAQCSTPHLQVANIHMALAQVARHNRRQSDALVIGVTGSVGKTTTRQMIAAVMSTGHVGIQSPRNFNNHIGVPLSLLELQADDEFAVIELGASAPNEIRRLAAIAEPEFGVITRVAPAHLQGFGSLQAVQKNKRALVEALPRETGVAFLNADDPLVVQMAASVSCKVVTFGTSAGADVHATSVEVTEQGLTLVVDGFCYSVNVLGSHNSTNALAAIAVGLEVGLSPEQINQGLCTFSNVSGRGNLIQVGDWNIIDDTYNSSPASMTAAIRTLEEFGDCHHRIAILSDMLDLGDQSSDLHYGIGSVLAKSNIDHVVVTGQYAEDVADGYRDSGGSLNRISVFSDNTLMTSILDCLLSNNDAILVKGSRGTRMERVIDRLRNLAVHNTGNGHNGFSDRRAA